MEFNIYKEPSKDMMIFKHITIKNIFSALVSFFIFYMFDIYIPHGYKLYIYLFSIILGFYLSTESKDNQNTTIFASLKYSLMFRKQKYVNDFKEPLKTKKGKIINEVKISSLIPIRKHEAGHFIKENGYYMDIFKVLSIDLVNITSERAKKVLGSFYDFNVAYKDCYSIITKTHPISYKEQIEYLEYNLSKEEDEALKEDIRLKIKEFKEKERSIINTEYYIQVYGKSLSELKKNREILERHSKSFGIEKIPYNKKKEIYRSLTRLTNEI